MSARIILLVGTSSAGKSTLASALQAALPEHFLLFALDDVFRMVSPRWGGGLGGPLTPRTDSAAAQATEAARILSIQSIRLRISDVSQQVTEPARIEDALVLCFLMQYCHQPT